jgi:hypothetical protein
MLYDVRWKAFLVVLQQVDDFLRVLQFPPNKTDRHAITEILLKVDLESKMATW